MNCQIAVSCCAELETNPVRDCCWSHTDQTPSTESGSVSSVRETADGCCGRVRDPSLYPGGAHAATAALNFKVYNADYSLIHSSAKIYLN